MGILDSLESSGILGQLGAAVLPAVLGEVLGTGNQGGLNAIIAKLQQAGLGNQVSSWLGNGQNLPITADQIKQVLGSDVVRQLAAKYNIPVDQISEVLAHQLPVAVDQASPTPEAARAGTGTGPMALNNQRNSRICHVRMSLANLSRPML
jgi:uncharacterized protein YidB (DUF937 family)